MGLSGGGKCICVSCPLSIDEFLHLLDHYHKKNIAVISSNRRKTIDIDANEVGYRYINAAIGPVDGVYVMSSALSKYGIDVNIIADPMSFRYHTKRETILRHAKKERARLKRINLQSQLNQALQETTSTNTVKIQDIEKELEKNKNICHRELPPDFNHLLQDLVKSEVKETNKYGNISFIADEKAQADVVIASRFERNLTDIIVSSDTDFAAYIGKRCMCVKDFKFDFHNNSIDKFILYTPSMSATQEWTKILKKEKNDNMVVKLSQYKIFEKEEDPLVRAVCAVAMGCDMWPGGIASCGPSNVEKYLTEINVQDEGRAITFIERLLKAHKKCQIKDKNLILCYAKAFV